MKTITKNIAICLNPGCGKFFNCEYVWNWRSFCPSCSLERNKKVAVNKMLDRKEKGLPIKSLKTRARKAVRTRIINLFIKKEFKKGHKMLLNLERHSKARANYIKRQLKRIKGLKHEFN